MVTHAGAAPSNAMIAGMIALVSVAFYWYMATTEEERASQANELKEKALEQANGKKTNQTSINFARKNFPVDISLQETNVFLDVQSASTVAAKDEAIKEAEKV
jgi:hypothetical protein